VSIAFAAIVALIVLAASAFAIWPVLRGAGRGRMVLAAAIAVFVIGIGAGTYLMLGRPALAVRTLEGTDTRDVNGLIALLAQRVHHQPDDVRAWKYLGQAYLSQGDPSDAAKAFARAIRLDPSNSEFYAAYGEAVVGMSSGAVPPEAEAAFGKALTLNPKDKSARYYLGFAFAARGDDTKAIALWQSLLDDAPQNAPWRGELRARIDALSHKPK
jgi:cytochrome c-type biogenesis protein CcmH